MSYMQGIVQSIVINRDKSIYVPEIIKKSIVQRDHNVDRLTFDCPRYWDGIDISKLNIYVNYIAAGQKKQGEEPESFLCENVVADEDNPDMFHFDWRITSNVSKFQDKLIFIVCAKSVDAEGNEELHWNSRLCTDLEVQEGLEGNDAIVEKYPDVIEQILQKLKNVDGASPEQIAAAVEEYIAKNPISETDPTVPDWAKQPQKPTYTASEVGAESAGTAEAKVSSHNTAADAHSDIRELITGLTSRLNALADSDDTTLDQMSEVVAYIKSNKSLIDAITKNKINVSDIINNLTTNVSNKPLSAAQGVALKALIDGITIPTKLSELQNDSGYAKKTDIPDTLPNPHKLTFSGAVTAEYDGSGAVTVTIPEGSGGSGGTARIEKLSTDTAVELESNKLYVFPEMTSLTITLATPSNTAIANEYHFVFQSGSTATTLTIPDTIKVPSGFSVDANKIYEISILEGCLCEQSWEVTA